MPLDPLLIQTTSDLAKLVRRRAVYGAVYDAMLGGVDGRRLGMGDYLLEIAPTAAKGNKAWYAALRKQLLKVAM